MTHCPPPWVSSFTGQTSTTSGTPSAGTACHCFCIVNSSDVEADWLCLMNGTSGMIKQFRWVDRNFMVLPKVIEDFVTAYLLDEHQSVCDEMQKRVERTNFVLFNAFCKASRDESIFVAWQCYQEEKWMLPKKPGGDH